jgi:hypothetical protein
MIVQELVASVRCNTHSFWTIPCSITVLPGSVATNGSWIRVNGTVVSKSLRERFQKHDLIISVCILPRDIEIIDIISFAVRVAHVWQMSIVRL